MSTFDSWVAGAFDTAGLLLVVDDDPTLVLPLPDPVLVRQCSIRYGGKTRRAAREWVGETYETLERFSLQVRPFLRGQRSIGGWLEMWLRGDILAGELADHLDIFYLTYRPVGRE